VEGLFHDVVVERYQDSLEVTDPEPLVSYVLSGRLGAMRSNCQVEGLRRSVASAIASRGSFHITKAQGLVMAIR
jgi:hypothetical protein